MRWKVKEKIEPGLSKTPPVMPVKHCPSVCRSEYRLAQSIPPEQQF